jgi:beta-glucosidase
MEERRRHGRILPHRRERSGNEWPTTVRPMTTEFADAAHRVATAPDPNTRAHLEARLLVGQMTFEEQLGCLDGDLPFWPGLMDMARGGYYTHSWPAARVERLGIPGIDFADGPRGCVVGDATAFPVSMARGATFDPDLEERVGAAIGAELRASGASFTGAVCLNLLRHPAWGRAQETYGEDPHHVGEMAAALTRGLQRHVMACMKHFALNSMENARFSVDVSVDERALHEVYLPHFRRVAEEGVAAVMTAYNSVNGEWCGENRTLLTTILREEWGWDGFVISDFIFGLRDAVKSVAAGLDIEMPFRQQRAIALAEAISSGRLAADVVETSVQRIVATLLRFHQVFEQQPFMSVVGGEEHRRLAREVAGASTVLLRNVGGLLPVERSSVTEVAVLGRLAAVANLGDGGSSDVKSSQVITPLEGIRHTFPDATVHYRVDDVAGCDDADLVVVVVGYTKADEGEYIDNAGTAALMGDLFPPNDHPRLGLQAPTAAVGPVHRSSAMDETGFGGSDSDGEGDGGADRGNGEASGMARGGDRVSLRLSPADEQLVAAACAANPRTVVAVQAGSAVVMPWFDQPAAVLVSWYAGVEGGAALGEILVGDREPGGRLPFAVPTDEADLPGFDRDAPSTTYGLFHGQWHLDRHRITAHLPFGFGLGYTTFRLGSAQWAQGAAAVEVTVTNVGDRSGGTVVFVHAGIEASDVDRADRRLVGFRRITADAGEEVAVSIAVDWRMLDVRRDGGWYTEPGQYVVDVGLHAHDPAAAYLDLYRTAPNS